MVTTFGGMAALLLAVAPLAVLVALALLPSRWALPAGGASAALVAGGALGHERSSLARLMVLAGLAVVPLLGFERLLASPALALATVVLISGIGWLMWDVSLARSAGLVELHPSAESRRLAALRSASCAALLALALSASVPAFTTRAAQAAVASSLCVAVLFILAWSVRFAGAWTRRMLGLTAIVALGGALPLSGGAALSSLALLPALALLVARGREQVAPAWLATILDHPARLVVSTFVGLCLAGTVLLALPVSASSGRSIGFLDAAFTSTSAVCVTGLIVLDTPSAFTRFGQAVILALIQVGGLGIMTFYTVALQFFGRRLSLRHELTVAGATGVEHPRGLLDALRRVLVVTGAAELSGALVLAAGFIAEGESAGAALWRGVFTAISAFCNAGFALQTESLIPYQTNLLIVHSVGILIVLGGLSPLAIVSLPRIWQRKPVSLQVKLILVASIASLVAGSLAYAAMEWSDSLGHLSRWQRAHNAWFQSVTTRTAGFNSVDLTTTRGATRTLLIVLMLIGGSPGGTAGGIKTTTVALLVLAVVSALRGRDHVVAFGRHIKHGSIYKGAAVATVLLFTTVLGIVAVQLTQQMPFDVGVFEVVSAICTVGLSLGGTSMLDEVGKVVVIALMFAGRVGPLTLFLFLVDRRAEPDWQYPDEQVDVA